MSHERFHHDPCVVHAAAGSVRQTVASKTKMDLIQAILSILLAVVAGLAVIQLVIGSWKTRGRRNPLPPVGFGLPYIGDTFAFISQGPAIVGRPHHARLGNIYRAWFLGDQVVHIGDVESAKQILNAEHDLVEEQMPYVIRELLGPRSVSTIHGKSHAQLRKLINPSFTPKAMAMHAKRLVELASQVCADMADAAEPKGEDGMKKFAFKANTEIILGFAPSSTTDELVARQQLLWKDWVEGLASLPINLPGFTFHRAMQARKAILAEYRDNIVKLIEDDNRSSGAEKKSPLELYIRSALSSDDFDKDVFDMEHFVNTAFNLLFAGHDTSASAMIMLLRYLSLCPEVLQKLRDEQSKVMTEFGQELDASAAAAMPYADAVVKEALRAAPIVPVVTRVALKTFQINGFTIPKGHKISVELWKLLEDDPRWKEAHPDLVPTKFNPDRWLTEEGQRAGSWMPFGQGQRMCLGFNFALLKIKIMLAVLARGYEWEVRQDEPVKTFPMPIPAWGLPMAFHKLKRPVMAREE